ARLARMGCLIERMLMSISGVGRPTMDPWLTPPMNCSKRIPAPSRGVITQNCFDSPTPRAARLKAVKPDLGANLATHGLSVAAVAHRERVTPRYIHMLFEREGITFSQFVLAERLAYAHRLLKDPRHAHQSIGAIAYAGGFDDLSHFNHAFRRRYAATPSDVRRKLKAMATSTT